MPHQLKVDHQDKRTGQERRRFGLSMIRNYSEYDGPERRSSIDRRHKEERSKTMSRSVNPTIKVPGS